ncbi:MAG: sulfite exporter TauE/SafE family protein, partial [Pseudomonadota bacterium]|nr:sulfite exporter TauE/SafE family protein [Pseudomonadota bacterium]
MEEVLFSYLNFTLTKVEILFISGGIFFAGFIRGFVGFGASLIIVLVLSLILGPHKAVPIAALSGLPSMLQLLPTAIKHSEKAFVLPFGIAAFFAAPLGTWVLVIVDPELMKIYISSFVLVMVYFLYRNWRFSKAERPTFIIGLGAAAGLIQGAAGVGGPPAVILALSRLSNVEKQRANVIGAVTTLNICSLIPLWYYGFFSPDVVAISIFLFPLYVLAT